MTPARATDEMTARRISVRGIVQGVGFRPFVYRIAVDHNLAGWVFNDASGVEIHAEGHAADVDAFLHELQFHPPTIAQIEKILSDVVEPERLSDFRILISRHNSVPTVRISPDLATCDDCLHEMRDPHDRRYQYPYINCSQCGPRYSIVEKLPYDRSGTTMAAWTLCPRCQSEYHDPRDRRHHAQPTACKLCGPAFDLIEGSHRVNLSESAIVRAAELLRLGMIVALKGLGGYHLACDARNSGAVTALRERKFRKERPFALLVRNLEEARRYATLSPLHEELLSGVQRPIVLAPGKLDLSHIAPGTSSLGIMLPYSPLHSLLFDLGAPSPLVLTSGNRSSEPIAYRDDEAMERLTGIADAILTGERPIARRVDDSVITVRANQPFMIRRARGHAPGVVCQLPTKKPILALGSDLKNAIALVVDGNVVVSQHIGDLEECETQSAFENTVRDLLTMYDVKRNDVVVAHDLHPQFHSTRFAAHFPIQHRIAVQHHHAHMASVLAEHDLLSEPVVGVTFDGTGYGTDGTIWGGEFFAGSLTRGFERCHFLRPCRIPGGDSAARFPEQAAAGFLAELDDLPDMTLAPFALSKRFTDAMLLVKKNVRCFVSTSMGRLFDTVAALLGFVRETSFEAQAAIWLEHQATLCPPQRPYAFPGLDFRPLLQAVIDDRQSGRSVAEIASSFHSAVSAASVTQILLLCRTQDLKTVVLSGGVFQNELLLASISEQLQQHPHIRLYINQQVPANDGGICVGQAAIASATSIGK